MLTEALRDFADTRLRPAASEADRGLRDAARAARSGGRARDRHARRPRGARRRGDRALDRHCRAGRRGARARRHRPRRGGPRPGGRRRPRSACGATPTSRRLPAHASPPRSRRSRRSRARAAARCSIPSRCAPRRGATAATGSSSGDKSLVAARGERELFVVAADARGQSGPALFVVESAERRRPAAPSRAGDGPARRRHRPAVLEDVRVPAPRARSARATRAVYARVRAAAPASPGARSRSARRRRCSTTSSRTSTSAWRSASRSPTARRSRSRVADIAHRARGHAARHLRAAGRADQGKDFAREAALARSALRGARRCGSAPTACSCSAATATSRSTRSSAGTATCGPPA